MEDCNCRTATLTVALVRDPSFSTATMALSCEYTVPP